MRRAQEFSIYCILYKVNSLPELMSLKLEDLEDILGSKHSAKDLFEALHESLQAPEADSKNSVMFMNKKSKTSKPGSRFKTKRK